MVTVDQQPVSKKGAVHSIKYQQITPTYKWVRLRPISSCLATTAEIERPSIAFSASSSISPRSRFARASFSPAAEQTPDVIGAERWARSDGSLQVQRGRLNDAEFTTDLANGRWNRADESYQSC